MKTIIVQTNQKGISEDGLPTYSQNNELIRNERVEVELEYQYDLNEGVGWLDCDETWYNQMIGHEKKYPGAVTVRRIYRQIDIKEESNGDKLNAISKTDSGWLDKAKVRASSAQPVKEGGSAEHMLNDAAKNLGHSDAFDMLWTGEVGVNLPIILTIMDEYAKAYAAQFANSNMVDIEKVVSILQYQMTLASPETLKSLDEAITQIRNL